MDIRKLSLLAFSFTFALPAWADLQGTPQAPKSESEFEQTALGPDPMSRAYFTTAVKSLLGSPDGASVKWQGPMPQMAMRAGTLTVIAHDRDCTTFRHDYWDRISGKSTWQFEACMKKDGVLSTRNK